MLRLDGWRDASGPLETVRLNDGLGTVLEQDLGDVARETLDDWRAWDDGRYEGTLGAVDLSTLLRQPAVMQLRPDPAFAAFNDQSRGHMGTNVMTTYFTTDLDGSGQTVAVADAGLDEDHGDFGNRVVGNYDVIGDGSTADRHSGHGTHVACTVLGDGFRGGYGGVAQAADLYFQAMENDNTGNFQSPSLNNLLNTAYNAGARTHTNSWGSSATSQQGKYNSETEDVDDRASYYDRYYNGGEGLTILFAAGNDGPGSGTVSPPATAKNVLSVGNHKTEEAVHRTRCGRGRLAGQPMTGESNLIWWPLALTSVHAGRKRPRTPAAPPGETRTTSNTPGPPWPRPTLPVQR